MCFANVFELTRSGRWRGSGSGRAGGRAAGGSRRCSASRCSRCRSLGTAAHQFVVVNPVSIVVAVVETPARSVDPALEWPHDPVDVDCQAV